MKKNMTLTYPADPSRVSEMLADPDYQRLRAERLRLSDAQVDVAARGRGFVATVAGSVPASALPQAAQKFIRSAVSFSLAESWGEPAEDGSRTGGVEVSVKGAPVRVGATSAMRPAADGASTTVDLEVDLSVSVPLVGRSIEERAMGLTDRAVADEEARAAQWLSTH
ncbi:MAG: DUF2505 domain-containing protein [Actinomyces sp.]|uniref:DUF2505 domain-containing protein n=1 Tax=Actinomyces sp. TaxID=29317 RepID=UPI0026DC57CE|nr:DUF2505 domain-containing protein [Actinomyces sp.]MDO4244060.1 DUF2505 domain-containing protein [Actinomyces sp.]